MRFGWIFGVAVAVVAAQSAFAAGLTRDQVRVRILDQCVMTQSGKLAEEGAGPKCNCYATRISKAMTDQEIAAYTKALPKRVAAEANQVFASCK